MKPPLRVAAAVASIAATASVACTPEEIAFHVKAVGAAVAAGYPCPQAAGWVQAAGFTPDQTATVHRLMWAESRCDPKAVGPNGERGLMQLHPVWFDDCGDLFDPSQNLDCARHVYEVQGWEAWSTY